MRELLLVLLLASSAFFSASETAFFTQKGGAPFSLSEIAAKLLENPIKFLSFILLSNNLINFSFSALGTWVILTKWGEHALTLGTMILTLSVIIFGEILPKTIASFSFKKVVSIVAPSLYFLSRILMPISSLFYLMADSTLKIFLKNKKERPEPISQRELEILMEEAIREGLFLPEERRIIEGITELERKKAEEVMQPRLKIVALPLEARSEQAVELFRNTGLSRVPLFRSNIDEIVGVLHARDLLHNLALNKELPLQKLMKPTLFVPEGITLDRLLGEFKKRQIHIAIVIDEYGGTSGVITLEDILEEIVGEIWDEYDQVKMKGLKINTDTYLCSAEIERAELERLGIKIPEGFGTLASFLIELSGRIPQVGEKIFYQGWEFTVLAGKLNKMETIKVSPCGN